MPTIPDPGFHKLWNLLFGSRRFHINRRAWSLILVVAGSGILGYVASQYWYMYHTQRVLELEWERQAAARSHVAADAPLLTRISIPKINLEAIVLEGASPEQLAAGPGHLTDTALPGQAGNAVITGHRDTFFRRIFELETGDEVLIARGSLVFRYQVTSKKVVKPDDMSVLEPTSDAQLTLITCYPIHYIGPAPKRLVVSSRLVATDPSTSPASLLQ